MKPTKADISVPHWFGKGCKWLSCQYETEWDESAGCEPVLVYCNHKENTGQDCEGNCHNVYCPIIHGEIK